MFFVKQLLSVEEPTKLKTQLLQEACGRDKKSALRYVHAHLYVFTSVYLCRQHKHHRALAQKLNWRCYGRVAMTATASHSPHAHERRIKPKIRNGSRGKRRRAREDHHSTCSAHVGTATRIRYVRNTASKNTRTEQRKRERLPARWSHHSRATWHRQPPRRDLRPSSLEMNGEQRNGLAERSCA